MSPEEKAIGAKIIGLGIGCAYSPLRYANHAAEGEWRWKHDRDAFMVESGKSQAKAAAERAAEEERYRTRLKNLSWDKLLAETPFERWVPSPPFPPAEFTEAARETIRNTYRELRELGPKPPKRKCDRSFDVVSNVSTKRTKPPAK